MAFFRGIKKSYPLKLLYEEMAFISYYFHWSYETVMQLDHVERARWCSEISNINKTFNEEAGRKNVFDVDI